jgi:Flp pilus assembly protein TadD
MPPEQARGEVERVGRWSDVFGLGAILCEVLTGRPPFDGKDRKEALARARACDHAEALARLDSGGADAELVRLCKGCLAAEPADRPGDAGAVAQAVAAYQAEVQQRLRRAELEKAAAEARATEARATAAAERRARRRMLALAAAVVLAGGGWVWQRAQSAWQETERAQRTEADLDEAARLLEAEKLAAYSEALERAEGRLAGGGPPDLRRRAKELRDLLGVVRRLEQARLTRASGVREGVFDWASGDETYRKEFARYGLGGDDADVEEVARRISASAIKGLLVAALDDWASISPRARRRRLLAIASRVDTDDRRKRLRDALARGDKAEVMRFAREAKPERLPPSTLVLLGHVLGRNGGADEAVRVLKAGQRRHPGDFWINHKLAMWLLKQKPSRPGEAAGYLRAALAARPDSPGTQYNLGTALLNQGRPKEAEAEYRAALRLKRDFPKAHNNLGNALLRQGRPKEAEAEYREAIRLKRDYPKAHNNLGTALLRQGRPKEAEAEYRAALRLEPNDPEAYLGLGTAVLDQGRPKEAEAEYRAAIRLKPDFPEAHCNLGHALKRQGRFEEALSCLKRGHELGTKQPGWRYPSGQWVRDAERLVALDRKLATVRKGQGQPADAAELLALAQFCQQSKKLPRAAVRLYADAFAAEPKLAAQPRSGQRYNAARAAALAAAGQGEDAGKLTAEERARLRQQALDWLRADLAAWTRMLGPPRSQARAAVRQTLQHWQKDADLASVRDRAALDKLAEAERDAWQRLWADVGSLLQRANEK